MNEKRFVAQQEHGADNMKSAIANQQAARSRRRDFLSWSHHCEAALDWGLIQNREKP
jgi:hypothetical protein